MPKLSWNELNFDKKYPEVRLKITRFLTKELRDLKEYGFPNYDLRIKAHILTKHITNFFGGE